MKKVNHRDRINYFFIMLLFFIKLPCIVSPPKLSQKIMSKGLIRRSQLLRNYLFLRLLNEHRKIKGASEIAAFDSFITFETNK